ncbi:MAG: M24 family metallopeptidase C-terminal domain-containing protein, partial [Erysipelotrichaceae bacterium]|nr:M24 family metallopeptidase C-terminal domain-containing protein [Erysipelotrichaceae bacterium]
TFVLGPLTKEQKKWYTLALMGHIDLARCRWLYGAKGSQLDILARNPLWQHAMDYQCGTGHGVGHVLSVHEDPNAIRSKGTPREAVLEAGMITSDEPGVYLEGQYGIRHENELLAVNDKENEYGQFMHFEVLTMVPFCTEGLDLSLMNADQLDWLNQYHQTVYDTIHPYLSEEEKDWLYTITRPLPL